MMAKGPAMTRPRTAARVGAVQALFQAEQGGENPEAVIDQFVRHRLGELPGTLPGDGGYEAGRVPDAHVKLFGRIVREAVEKQSALDLLLAQSLPVEWPIGRLDPVLRALLRAAGAEFSMRDGPPVAVVINEYMDVAHGFFAGEEPRMANGLMETMARTLRPREFEVRQ